MQKSNTKSMVKDGAFLLERHGGDGQWLKAYPLPGISRDHKVIIFDTEAKGPSSKTLVKYTTAMLAADGPSFRALGVFQN